MSRTREGSGPGRRSAIIAAKRGADETVIGRGSATRRIAGLVVTPPGTGANPPFLAAFRDHS